MANDNMWDNIEAFKLKECYDLATHFEKLDIAKDILREKSKKIKISNDLIPMQTDGSYQETEMQIVSEALYGLTIEGFAASENAGFKYEHKISNLQNSAEKEFVLALLSLRNGTSETQRLDALNHIRVALSYSPDDPRYIALASVLQEVSK